MQRTECRFQALLKPEDIARALEEGRCHSCSITAADLPRDGKELEVCGEEFICDLPGGQDVSVPVALCPECHRQAHLDADNRLVPCHAKARRSREWIDWPGHGSAESEAERMADLLD